MVAERWQSIFRIVAKGELESAAASCLASSINRDGAEGLVVAISYELVRGCVDVAVVCRAQSAQRYVASMNEAQ